MTNLMDCIAMKIKHLLAISAVLFSTASFGQAFTLSGGYSPTFESINFGFGLGDENYLMDYQLGLGDEFYSFAFDLSFAVTDDLTKSSPYTLSNIYLGAGGEMMLMDDIDKDLGYAVYGLITYSYNLVALSYGYGFYEYDGIPTGGLDGFHRIKLTLILGEIETY